MATIVTWNGSSYTVPATGEENWGGSTKVDGLLVSLAQNGLQKTGGNFTLSADVDFGGTAGLKATYYKSRSASPASAGVIRLGNNERIGWRNAADNTDLPLYVDTSNRLTFYSYVIMDSATGLIPVASGSTGIASYTAGDMLYATASTTLAKLAIGAANRVLVTNGSAPSWALIANANVDGSAAIAYSKLNLSGSILNADVSASAAIAYSKLAALTASRALASDGSGIVSVSTVTTTELQRLSGIGSAAVGVSDTQTLTNKTLTAPTITSPAISGGTLASATITASTLRDSDCDFVDNSDNTKVLRFQCSSISTGTVRTWTIPDFSDTLVGLTGVQTLTNKTLTTPTIASVRNTAGVKVQGSNTNDNADAGDYGEYDAQSRVESSRGNVATATAVNVTSSPLALTAGDWDIEATVVAYSNSNAITQLVAAISKTSATLPAADTNGVPTSGEYMRIWDMPSTSPGAGGKMSIVLPRIRASVGSTTNFYLVFRAAYTGGTNIEYYGSMTARRVR